ncbi:MAG: hypothetical protein ACRDRW_05845 [Pseudonocardiaceae bacterium]
MSLVWVVAVIGARGSLSLLALSLRLRWQLQRQRERHHYLVAIARALPEGSQIDEGQPDGTWLRLTMDRPQADKADHG